MLKRGSSDGFKLTDMAKSTVLMKSGGGASVSLFFKMLLRENGIDARAVDYVQDLDGIMLGNLFQGGMGDYFITDNLSAMAMVERNPKISIAMEMVTQGDVPWSVYYRETETISTEILDSQKRFCIGLTKGIDWVLQHDVESFRDKLAELFHTVPVDVAVSMTNNFRRNDMWTSTSVNRQRFAR
jgi:NitT/TauT family transport system substrate-binding protein